MHQMPTLIIQMLRPSLQKIKQNKEKITGRGGMREREAAVLIKTRTDGEEKKKDSTGTRVDTEIIAMTETGIEMVMAEEIVIMIKEDINIKFSLILLKPKY